MRAALPLNCGRLWVLSDSSAGAAPGLRPCAVRRITFPISIPRRKGLENVVVLLRIYSCCLSPVSVQRWGKGAFVCPPPSTWNVLENELMPALGVFKSTIKGREAVSLPCLCSG